MKNLIKILIFGLLSTLCLNNVNAATDFYNIEKIQKIEITFTQANWDYLLDTAKNGSDGYTMGSISINGTKFDSVGIKYKGNSSYDSTYKKNPFNIALDQYKSQNYQGLKSIKLANCYQDPSMIRDVLGYNLLSKYMECPRANFAQVYINGVLIGLYSNTEPINKQFCSDRFGSSANTFYSCSPIIKPTPTIKSSLKLINGKDSTGYFDYYEIKSKFGWKELVNLCDSVTNSPSSIPNLIDIDRLLWMLAYDNLIVNLDSYIGVFSQNYYLYKDASGRFAPIVWDLNMSFGGFPYIGSGTTSMGTLSISEMAQLPIDVHINDINWPLIKNVLSVDEYKTKYYSHLRTMIDSVFANDYYLTYASKLRDIIDTAVTSDKNKFFTYLDFKESLTKDINVGPYTVPGIQNLMTARLAYLKTLPFYTNVTPKIENVGLSKAYPVLNDNLSIKAKITGSTKAYLYVSNDKYSSFTKYEMFDDGAHGDENANDGIYGATFKVAALECRYYISANNDLTYAVSPVNAEKEYYTLKAAKANPKKGEVVINEFLAKNAAGQKNEKDSYEDWIELYNTTSSDINLYGMYLSDDAANIKKFTFPENAVIKAKSYLTLWADENETTSTYIHCNFKLGASGEQIILTGSDEIVLDSFSFGAQTSDVSMGRCPNGTGDFKLLTKPTFNAENDCTSLGVEQETIKENNFAYPNPFTGLIQLSYEGEIPDSIKIYSQEGILVKTLNPAKELDLNDLAAGVYFVDLKGKMIKIVKI